MDGYKPFAGSSGDTTDDANGYANAAVSANFLNLGGGNGGSDSGSGGSDERFDASIHVSPDKRNADGSYRKKRGRKSGSGNSASSGSKRQASNSANIESLTSILAIVHAGLASATKTPEIALEMDEAESLAKSAANVLIEFDIQPNPKVQAIVGLVMTAGAIYGPRVYLAKERWKEEREEKRK